MGIYPRPMEELIGLLSKLPGLGPKSGLRIALYLLSQPQEVSLALGRLLLEFKEKVRLCGICSNLSEEDPCPICKDPKRDRSTILVVESPGDMYAIEEAGAYKGLYHILHGTISPLDKTGPEDLRLQTLMERGRNEEVTEIIVATNPTFQGEATANYILDLLQKEGIQKRISRIAIGLPMGGDLKYADKVTLELAIRDRKAIR